MSLSPSRTSCIVGMAPTTTFTPPRDCTTWTSTTWTSEGDGLHLLYNPQDSNAWIAVPFAFMSQRSCFPDIVSYSGESSSYCAFVYTSGFCPSGWTDTSTAIVNPRTSVYCCPSNGPAGSVSMRIDNNICSARVDLSTGIGPSTVSATPGSNFANLRVPPIVLLRFALTRSASEISTTLTSSTSLSTSLQPSSSVSIENSSVGDGKGLSTGAKAGIGVGVPVAVFLIFLAGFLCWRQHRKGVVGGDGVHHEDNWGKPELHGDSKPPVEAGAGRQIYEMEAPARAVEVEQPAPPPQELR